MYIELERIVVELMFLCKEFKVPERDLYKYPADLRVYLRNEAEELNCLYTDRLNLTPSKVEYRSLINKLIKLHKLQESL